MEQRMTGAELLAAPEKHREFAIEDLLPLGSVAVIAAKKGRGKSVFSLVAADRVSRGAPFLGRVTKQGQVLYIGTEDDQIELTGRYRRLLETSGEEPSKELD